MAISDLKIGIIILNWRRPEYTIRCIESIYKTGYPNLAILVVENNSGDGSVEKIRAVYPSVEILESNNNLGFTGGNNLGIQHLMQTGLDYFLLLNDDIVIDQSAINLLAQAAGENPSAGFLGPVIHSLEERKVILSAGGQIYPRLLTAHYGIGRESNDQYAAIEERDFLSGCALLVNREVIEKVGLLDDQFFMYYEEVDWCLRARNAGFRCLLVPGARVYHPDTRTRDENSAVVTYYSCRNRLLLARKNHLGFWNVLRITSGYLRQLLSWSIKPKWRYKSAQRKALAQALADFSRNNFGMWVET